jgi:multidrug efflux pump subunit AcrB
MKKLIEYFIKYPVAGNILVFVILIVGGFSLLNIRSTLTPQIDPGIIMITAVYPGASPEEIEEGIILKIEDNLKGLTGIDKVTSTSKENVGVVSVKLETNAKSDIVLQDVKNAVDGISSFPAGMEPPNIKKVEYTAPALFFSVSGEVDLKTLKTYARLIEDELREIDGVSKVELSGFPDEEIEIGFRENDLRAYGLTFTEAYAAIKSANIDLTGGIIRGEDEELYVRTKQKQYYAEGLRDIVLRSNNSGIVRLCDVANVQDRWSETPNKSFIDGKPAIQFSIMHTNQEDIIDISENITEYIEGFNAKNEIVKVSINYDVSTEIDNMQSILLNNGVIGFLLVLLFLSLFLNHRLSFWVAISLPLSFMGMFILAGIWDVTLNKISLFGMILVVGILVDDGIVIAESIYQHWEKGAKPLKAAVDGTMEVMAAVFSGVMTTIIAFSSFFFIDGMFGQFMVEMAFVVIGVLIFSLIEGFLILPAHVAHSKALDRNKKKSKVELFIDKLIHRIRERLYVPVLKWALNNKISTILIPIGLMIITFGAYTGGIIKTGDSSIKSQDYTNVTLEMPAGTPESLTTEYLFKIEKDIWALADELNTQRNDGRKIVQGVQLDITAANYGKIFIFLLESEYRNMHSMAFSNMLRDKVGPIPEAERLNFVQESHFGKPVSVSLKSSNIEELMLTKDKLKEGLNDLAGLKNIEDNYETGMREVKITLKDKAYLFGLTLQDVMDQVRYGFYGLEVQRINRGLDLIKVWVRYDKADRSSIGSLENMRITTADGNSFPLMDIANLEYERNLVSINHLNGRREITIVGDLVDETINLQEIRDEIDEVLVPEIMAQYPGISIYEGGHREEMNKAASSIMLVIPIILVVLIGLITFTFRSFMQTILVFALIPFGLIGVGWGHVFHGYSIDMPSYFGMVALMGVMVNDAIVMISKYNDLLRKGKTVFEAVYEASTSRFRPIILTSLTTIAGLFPLILSPSPDAAMVVPMAISVAYGMMVATLLTLLMLPVLLVVVNSLRVKLKTFLTGEKVQPESLEQAVKELKFQE